jgi:WD40 repeat protein
MSDYLHLIDQENIGLTRAKQNPFPGLRAFHVDESHLFFGREGQSDEVLDKLSKNKFVGIIGASGSGKSSFMFCGVIPILYGGFLSHIGPNWHVITTRPGGSPIDNLAEALLQKDASYLVADNEDKRLKKTITSTLLKSSSLGLIEAVKQLHLDNGHNILIVADQFEELFRFKRSEDTSTANESLAYINLLMEAVKDLQSNIYVVLTMRSDFIGDCAQFPELTKYINESHYLIPQMVREQKRLAIEGPVAVGGADISPRLVQQLLNDLGDNPDQLPIIQHALMRTWTFWAENHEQDEILDLRHYEAIGSMSGALSQHADEAYDELTEQQKFYCEILFKTLTEKGSDSAGIRRPTKLSVIAAVAGCSEDDMAHIIDHFRVEGRSLLMPPTHVSLDSDSIIDISHESLMRIWTRLKKWVEEEGESSQMYVRLSEAASNYQVGKAGLWRPPDLQLALNWKQKNQPTLVWAQRYDSAFERAMVFLDTSNEAHEEEQRLKELAQKQALKRARTVALVLGIFTIMALGSLVFSIVKMVEANKERERAEAQTVEAKKQRDIADKQRVIADEQKKEAQKQKDLAVIAAQEAKYQQEVAEKNFNEAEKQRNIAVQFAAEARKQQKIAEMQSELAIKNEQYANKEKDRADKLRLLSIAQSMAVKSVQIEDDTMRKGLLAFQAYEFYDKNGGNVNQHEIYDGLYYALKDLKVKDYNALHGHKDAVRSVVYTNDGKAMYTAGSDGKILKWDMASMSPTPTVVYTNTYAFGGMSISPSNQYLAMGGSSPNVRIIDLAKPDAPLILNGHRKNVLYTGFTSDGQALVTAAADSTIMLWNLATGKSTIVYRDKTNIKAVSLHPKGRMVAIANDKGETIIISLYNEFTPYTLDKGANSDNSLEYSHDGEFLAIANSTGLIKIMDVAGKRLVVALPGHKARVNEMEFSNDDSKLASASFDGTIRVWDLSELSEQPLILKDHSNWVWSMAFSPQGDKLIAGCGDNLIRVWPTSSKVMADQMCGLIKRNMTGAEWKRYVAKEGVPYERTCPDLPSQESNMNTIY